MYRPIAEFVIRDTDVERVVVEDVVRNVDRSVAVLITDVGDQVLLTH